MATIDAQSQAAMIKAQKRRRRRVTAVYGPSRVCSVASGGGGGGGGGKSPPAIQCFAQFCLSLFLLSSHCSWLGLS
jgi:hypothetical protein